MLPSVGQTEWKLDFLLCSFCKILTHTETQRAMAVCTAWPVQQTSAVHFLTACVCVWVCLCVFAAAHESALVFSGSFEDTVLKP